MKTCNTFAIICLMVLSVAACKNAGIRNVEVSSALKDWEMVWSDEFEYTGLPDSTSWAYDVGGHGWGNQEKQYYTGGRIENARVENGMLIIEARKETWDSNSYTSARLVTRDKKEWLYGRFEIRAKLPRGTGTWPALWMLAAAHSYGEGYWPHNGEIDIMEHVGFNQGSVHASTHSLKYFWQIGTQRTDTIISPDVSDAFHNYILEWYPEKLQVIMDDSLYFTSLNDGTGWEAWPFDKPFYLILNIAVGGAWGGQKGVDDSVWPQRMEVDYVRVYGRRI
ncbi:MAG TPA: glycoside hydrolase family 16 protein [Bacteroidales bacterium]|nr:glycoside hydrolase family 16 protein [Bacteroidales bacterium]